jgi:hypothetical protein
MVVLHGSSARQQDILYFLSLALAGERASDTGSAQPWQFYVNNKNKNGQIHVPL